VVRAQQCCEIITLNNSRKITAAVNLAQNVVLFVKQILQLQVVRIKLALAHLHLRTAAVESEVCSARVRLELEKEKRQRCEVLAEL
jgi:hypothetical protein